MNEGGDPLGLQVSDLSRDMGEALPEVGVEDPPDRGLSQTFPTDPHSTLGSVRSARSFKGMDAEPTYWYFYASNEIKCFDCL